MTTHCFYHSADFDGICAAAIVHMFEPTAKFIPINYGQPLLLDKLGQGDTVYVVDFSFPQAVMAALDAKVNLIWIDHHKSALESAEAAEFNPPGLRSVEKAGCELTWIYFNGDQAPMPAAVSLLGRYDTWQWMNCPGALEFQYGLHGRGYRDPTNIDQWRILFTDETLVSAIIHEGLTIIRYVQANDAGYVKSCAYVTEFEGLRALCVNRGLCNTEIFRTMYDPALHDITIRWVYRKGEYHYSIASAKKEIDVSKIAQKYGGGGHRGVGGLAHDTLLVACPKPKTCC